MKLHFYEKEKAKIEAEFISEGEFHFVKKVKPVTSQKRTRFSILRK